MSGTENISNWFVSHVSFPLTNYLANRRNIRSTYAQLMKSERYPREVLRAAQLDKVRKVIEYAGKHVPFYATRFQRIGLEAQDIKSLEDVECIPPLSREEVIEHYKEMTDRRRSDSIRVAEQSRRGTGQPIPFARFRKHNLVRNTSSGSTGAPTVFFEDGAVSAASWANELRLRKWFGLEPGVKEARMARISTDYMPRSGAVVLRQRLWHQLMLPGVNLAEADYAYCLERIKRFRPRVIWGFTSALTGLGEYLLEAGESLGTNGPDLLVTWAAPLYDHEREVLSKAFNCPLTNIYGAREVGHIGARCPDDALHINQESLLVEVEADENPAEGAGIGEILVTTLVRTPMPFIRFRMGDIGSLSDETCSCGRSLQTFSQLLGRTGEVFVTKSGRMISPNFWCRTFMDPKLSASVKRFQVTYTKLKDLRIRIVADVQYGPDTEAHLKQFLKQNFDAGTQIEFEYVERIEPLVSGKYQMVVNESHSMN